MKNFVSLGAAGSTIDTGISINTSNGGATALALLSINTGAGTATYSEVGYIQFYYNGDNVPSFSHIAGSSISETDFVLGKSSNSTLTITKSIGSQLLITLILSKNIL